MRRWRRFLTERRGGFSIRRVRGSGGRLRDTCSAQTGSASTSATW